MKKKIYWGNKFKLWEDCYIPNAGDWVKLKSGSVRVTCRTFYGSSPAGWLSFQGFNLKKFLGESVSTSANSDLTILWRIKITFLCYFPAKDILISPHLKIVVVLLVAAAETEELCLRTTISQDLNLSPSAVFWKPPPVILEAKEDEHSTVREVAIGREQSCIESLLGKAGEGCTDSALLVAFQAYTARLRANQRVCDTKNIALVLWGWKGRGWCLEDQKGCGWVKVSKKNLSKCWR